MVVPDMMIVCDPEKVLEDRILGAPDFVAEIVSPSSKRRDYVIKSGKYCMAGVREYWIIDPDMERVLVYDFEADAAPVIYNISDEIPIRIYNSELKIRFLENV